jgi:hypothetical protein
MRQPQGVPRTWRRLVGINGLEYPGLLRQSVKKGCSPFQSGLANVLQLDRTRCITKEGLGLTFGLALK